MVDKIVLFVLKKKKLLLLILAVALLFVPFVVQSNYKLHIINIGFIYILPAVGLTILAGYTGQVSMCQATFFGLGAYLVGIFTKTIGLNIWLSILIVPFVVALIALGLGAPALRVKGHYLVLLTMAFGEICTVLATRLRKITGGPDGFVGTPSLKLFGINFSQERNFYYIALVLVIIVLFVVIRLSKSQYGITMKTVQQDDVAASMIGVNIKRQKLLSFMCSGFLAALGGGLYISYVGLVSPELMSRSESIMMLAMVTIGGMGNIVGSVIGGFVISILPEALRGFKLYYQLVFSLVIVLVMIYMPRGIAGLIGDLVTHARQRAHKKNQTRENEVIVDG